MKLEFINVSKINNRKKQTYHLLEAEANFAERECVAVLATHEKSTTTLLNLISGIEQPTRGKIKREGIFTGPIGDATYYHRDLSCEESIRFICKIYGQDSSRVIKDIKEFASVGKELKQKFKDHSPAVKRKIAISTSLLINSDVYQIKGPLNHPQPGFNTYIHNRLDELAKKATLILATTDKAFLNKYAHRAIVINTQGRLQEFSDLQSGIDAHAALKKGKKQNVI